jgi:hypothetical protein
MVEKSVGKRPKRLSLQVVFNSSTYLFMSLLINSFLLSLLYCSVMFGVMLYTVFRLYRNFEDEIVPYSSAQTIVETSFLGIVVNYVTSIYHITATFKCLPAFLAIVQVSKLGVHTLY